ncbi:Protein P [Amphibalanus amphitrite]|uniref:Protein P n=1 Tax=Amphibalanus amphitrite TaxID=1232801 RepID=A0A6A4V630_AMPAM|nr:Protein P [Amphibalanus amphitrite]
MNCPTLHIPGRELSDLDSLLGGIQGEEDGQLEASTSESESDEERYNGPPTVDLTALRPSPERPRRFMDHFHRLTAQEIREMAEQARAIQALPVDDGDEALQQEPPPAVASGPPEQEEDQDGDQDEEQQDEEEESPLSFISNRQASPATPEHEIDLGERPHPHYKSKILAALARLNELSNHQAQRLAGYLNFVRPVARLPLQLVIATLQRDPRVPLWVQQGTWDHVWEFRAEDYHNWFRTHPQAVAVDATPYQLGFADASAAIAVPLERPMPIYRAEFLAALMAALRVPPGTTVYSDNQAVIHNIHKGRCPPSWLPWMSALFACRGNSFRYVPSAANPADAPSRWGRPRES